MVVAMPARHRLAGRRVVTVEDIVDEPLFLYDFRKIVAAHLSRLGMRRRWWGVYEKTSPVRPAVEALLELLRAEPLLPPGAAR
jgi:DNA-binding transcriptional LysR family regulator